MAGANARSKLPHNVKTPISSVCYCALAHLSVEERLNARVSNNATFIYPREVNRSSSLFLCIRLDEQVFLIYNNLLSLIALLIENWTSLLTWERSERRRHRPIYFWKHLGTLGNTSGTDWHFILLFILSFDERDVVKLNRTDREHGKVLLLVIIIMVWWGFNQRDVEARG